MFGLNATIRSLKRRVAGWGVVLIVRCVNAMPEGVSLSFAAGIAWVVSRVRCTFRKRIQTHLSLVFGSVMTDEERNRLTRQIIGSMAAMAVEAARLTSMTRDEVNDRVDDGGCAARFAESLANRRSVMIITGHYGNWELLAAYVAQLGPLTVLARKNPNPVIESVIRTVRSSHGVRVLDRSDSAAPREMIRMGKEGGHFLGVLMDQDTTRIQGIFSKFLGIPALTPVGPASIAIRNDFDVYVSYLRPVSHRKHLLIAHGPLTIPSDGSRTDRLQAATDLFNEYLSDMILQEPKHWVWNHRRWRRKADSGVNL